jgi:hypothetical protein
MESQRPQAMVSANQALQRTRGALRHSEFNSTALLPAVLVLAATNIPRRENKRGPSGAER